MRMKIGMNVIEGGHRFCIGFFLAFGLIWTDSTLGDSALFLGRQYAVGSDPISVAIGDLNGDQVPDMAVANRGWRRDNDGNVAVRLGLGDGTFATAVKYAFGNAFTSIAIGDLDGDSVPDLAVANQDDDNVSVLLGLGDGTFSDGGNFPAGDGPQFVTIGDLNGDQVPDLAVASSGTDPEWDGNVAVLLGVGDGTFAVAVYYAAGISPRSIAIGDLDGDHVPDLAVASSGMEYGDDASVSVLIGVGDGTFSAAVPYAVGTWARSVAIGDLDGDQVPDLAVANERSDKVSVLLGIG
ncbi:MAG: VCBS repeat-containing protein, partial [Planctomycetes bacterium]|nr:VCBS repeat-containing protein [Planctomycetota bacterium]